MKLHFNEPMQKPILLGIKSNTVSKYPPVYGHFDFKLSLFLVKSTDA